MIKKIGGIILFFIGFHNVSAIDFSTLESKENFCPGANVSATIYIPVGQNSYATSVWDAFWHSQERVIANNGTLVKLWQSQNGLVTGCTNSDSWELMSQIAPGNNEKVVALSTKESNKCIYNTPLSVHNKTFQFVFNIKNAPIINGTRNVVMRYHPLSNRISPPIVELSKTYNNVQAGAYVIHENECLNVTLAWCGDGEKTNGEVCDPNDPQKSGWGTGGCSNTCQPVVTPATCNSLSISPSSGTAPLTSQFSCSGSGATSYKIDILNSAGTVLRTFNTPTASYSFSSTGSYSARCSINGNITSPSCAGNVTVTPPAVTPATCNSLNITPSSGTAPLTSQFSCSGSGATSYKIDILNSAGTVLRTFNTSTASYNFSSTGSYSARCSINGNITSPSCAGNVTVTTPVIPPPSSSSSSSSGGGSSSSSSGGGSSSSSSGGGSSSSGGGTTPGSGGGYCGDGYLLSTETCETHQWFTVERTCSKSDGKGGTVSYDCSYRELRAVPTHPACRFNCTYCGDGKLDDYRTTGEMCDFGSGTWQSWCRVGSCTIDESTLPGGSTDTTTTLPGGGGIVLAPGESILLGGGMGVFEYLASNNASIQNNSTSDIYIDRKLCVYKQGFVYNAVEGENLCSASIVGFLSKNGGKKNLPVADEQFVANITDMPGTITQVDGKIITTLDGLQGTNTFLQSTLKVRVAKPSVNTIGGGASLINGNGLSDVNKLSQGGIGLLKPEINRNAILTSLGVNPLSSYTKTVDDTQMITKSRIEGNKDLSGINQITFSGTLSTIRQLPTQGYNGLPNIFIHNGNVELLPQRLPTGPSTYIIQNGDLVIQGNLTSSGNILFVVKNGDVIIKNNVTLIDAIIINMGGDVKAESTTTLNRLVINGALYGNVSDLLAKRTYIKDRGEYVDVGTNVNFTSKIFSSPPPLLSKFLGEYLEGTKVPK